MNEVDERYGFYGKFGMDRDCLQKLFFTIKTLNLKKAQQIFGMSRELYLHTKHHRFPLSMVIVKEKLRKMKLSDQLIERLTEGQKEEICECFSLFKKSERDYLTLKEMYVAMSALGEKPSKEELKEIVDNVESQICSSWDFLRIMAVRIDRKKDFFLSTRFFVIFDEDPIDPTIGELRHVMRLLGERLTDEQINKVIHANGVTDDYQISVTVFLEFLYS